MKNQRILIKYASRSRPVHFFRGLENITSHIQTEDYQILCSLDMDDRTMTTDEVKDRLLLYPKVLPVYGTSDNKVQAINRDIWMIPDWGILINFSDDILFITKSVDQYIIEDFNKYFPNGDGFLHYPEPYGGDRQATMSIMDRIYYDRTGYIYNPDYRSVYCDNEALAVAKRLGRHQFVNRTNIFLHAHPACNASVPTDDLYRRNEEKGLYAADAAAFYRRQGVNFDL